MKYLIFGILVLSLLGSCQNRGGNSKLKIAAAANMQYAMDSLVKNFSAETGIDCDLIISSSGKLCTQILHGAPYDIFVSADTSYPQKLLEAGKVLGTPEVYAFGSLVLWSMHSEKELNMALLEAPSVSHIAVANPEIAPYGKATIETLEYLGIRENLESKLVYGESISSVNQLIYTGAADLGFTAKSVVLSPSMKGKGVYYVIDPDLYKPIAQALVVLKESEMPEEAEKFRKFMFSDKAKKVLEDYGYRVN